MYASIDSSYRAGREAFDEDESLSDNPHAGTGCIEAYRAWCSGWLDAQASHQLSDGDEDQFIPDDTPELQHCDDWGTGEGRYHGRM